jgi:hypothetical protein
MKDVVSRIMTLEEFAPLVGSTFVAECDPAPVGIELIEAMPLRNSAGLQRPPFVLTFRTTVAVKLIEGSYVLRCGDWGPGMIHMVPAQPPMGGQAGNYYTALFN